ncbi:MAG: hypothetical protein EOP05_11405, partial [Proteobacteria bacterium]
EAKTFGWNFQEAEDSGKLILLKITPGQLIEDLHSDSGVLTDAIKKIGAKRVVIDGLTPLRQLVEGVRPGGYREAIHELYEKLRSLDVTGMLTTEAINSQQLGETGTQQEHYICDTIITLRKEAQRRNVNRSLEVSKSRGQDYVAGRNSFRIVQNEGLRVFVRAYARERLTPPVPATNERVSVGIPVLEEMLGGGVYCGSSTLMIGVSGTGKTVAAMHFLAEGVKRGEKGLFITLDETPGSFCRNASSLGFDIAEHVENGNILISYESPLELDLDEHFAIVAEAIKKSGVKRVVIDSLAAYEMILPKESHEFLFAMSSYLKSQGITSMYNYECPEMIGVSNLGQDLKASSIADNIVLMNFVEISTHLRRAITVSKCHGPATEEQTREFVIRKGAGITLLDESTVPNSDRVPQLPLSSYYGVLARSPTRHSPIIDEHVASGKPMPKSRVPKPAKAAKLKTNSLKQ